MHNFCSAQGMKNPKELEDENDLTKLTLWVGSPKRVTHPSPSPSPSPSPPTSTPLQTDIQFMQIQQLAYSLWGPSFSNPNPNPNLMVSYSYNHINPQNVTDVNANVPTEDVINTPTPTPTPTPSPSLRRSKRSKNEKGKIVPVPFPWATDRRATIHSRRYLLQNNIHTITGKVYCRRCEQGFEMSVDVEEKVTVLRRFIERQGGNMHDRAPPSWSNPSLPNCVHCGRENSTKPVINKKREINWLFLLLTQTLGCCTLEHLKFFCKHTNTHRTGAKDRLLYLTYKNLCKQLAPELFSFS